MGKDNIKTEVNLQGTYSKYLRLHAEHELLIAENNLLQKKLELAVHFMTFSLIHEYEYNEYYMFHKLTCRKCAANKVLEEINGIK